MYHIFLLVLAFSKIRYTLVSLCFNDGYLAV